MAGVICTYSVVHAAPAEFSARSPYIVALVEEECGTRRSVFIDGYREGIEIAIGDEVEPSNADELGRKVWRLVRKT